MQIRDLVVIVAERWLTTGRDVLASTIAAAVAWFVAQTLFGHPNPVFAAIIAIVCLGPGLPSHTRQALGLLTGVGIGIVVGELALAFPNNIPLLRGSLSVFVAMMLASSFGLGPVVPIQAGVSTLLIFVLGPETAGYIRLIDSAVGIVVALLFSQVVLTNDPVSAVQFAGRNMLRQLGSGLSQCALALAKCDRELAHNAMERLSASHDSVVALGASIRWAEQAARWSLRGRMYKREIGDVVARYDRQSVKLYALVLLFGEALGNALSTEDPPPQNLRAHVHRLADLCQGIASGALHKRTTIAALCIADSAAPAWRTCVSYLQATEEALDQFAVAVDPSS